MPRIDLSSAGVGVYYAVETTAGTTPTTGYTKLTGISAIPDINPEPSSLDSTTLDETEWKSYIPGLKDPGGALAFTANNTEQFQTEWAALVTAAENGAATEGGALATWFAVIVPGLTKAFFFSGDPSPLGLSGVDVDSVLTVDAYITPTSITGWNVKPAVGQ